MSQVSVAKARPTNAMLVRELCYKNFAHSMHISFSDCCARDWNKQIYNSLLTISVCKISKKTKFEVCYKELKVET